MQKIFFYLISFTLLLSIYHPVSAETMLSPSYRIRFGNFNMTSGTKSSTSYSLTDTVGQTAAGLFDSNGYVVKAGFQYIYTLYDFAFAISDLSIDFGTLTPSSFSSGSNTLTVSAPGQGYSVTAFETQRLRSSSGDFVPDATCNSGTCTDSSAGIWDSTSAYGFGYNMVGHDIPGDFQDASYFRPFPDFSLGDSPAIVMSSSAAGENRSANVTYQVNVEGSQAAGNYTTSIVFIATPVY